MIYRFIYLLVVSILLVSCSSRPNIVIADFEGNTYGAWLLEGNAFGQGPARASFHGQQRVEGYRGTGFVNSFSKEGGDARGVLTSPRFLIERDYINFLIGGGKSRDTYIELLIDGKSVIRSSPMYYTNRLYPMSWNVEKYLGKEALIRIVDYKRGASGYILIDHIEQSDTPSTTSLYNYSLNFDVDKNYLLFPIQEDAPEIRVDIKEQGVPDSFSFSYMRLADTSIDYYVPVDISQYKGKKLAVFFEYIERGYVALADIKQSDTYNYKYDEDFRPSYHFSPKYGWMNDPSGLVYNNGAYNLYYEHNPYGAMWGNMSWGHATSEDLVNWKHESVVLNPDSLGTIFSGSVVVDKDNTAGFGNNALVALYTYDGVFQTQGISYSTDGGATYKKYEHNPVLVDPNHIDYRDPKVFWHKETKSWIMILATTHMVTIYSSHDLKNWSKMSTFGNGVGHHGGVWERPDLFPLQDGNTTKWVLLVGVNPGGPNGGSATQYFVGNFDGITFTEDNLPYPLWLDYGRDNYAGSTWTGAPNDRHIFIGWMSNWDYANYAPSINFRNALTIPRELSLGNNGIHTVLKNSPIKEVENLRVGAPSVYSNIKVKHTYTIDQMLPNNEGAYEIEMTIECDKSDLFSFSLQNMKKELVKFDFNTRNHILSIDRSKSGIVSFASNFASQDIEAPLVPKQSYQIRLLVDKASVEMFVDNGEVVSTNTIFPTEAYNKLIFESESQIVIKDITIYKLRNIANN